MKEVKFKNVDLSVRILKTLSHPVRLRIVSILAQSKFLSVGQIQQQFDLSQSTISQHLAILKNMGVLSCKREGNIRRYYILNRRICKLLSCLEDCVRAAGRD